MTKRQLQKALDTLKKNLTSKALKSAFDKIQTQIDLVAEAKVKPEISTNDFVLPKNFQMDFAVFSDGGCRGNPGPGAWAYCIQDNEATLIAQRSDFCANTTNNQMELTGALEGLKYLVNSFSSVKSYRVTVFSDSQYVVQGMNSWIVAWKKRQWKKADNKTPENLELWQALDEVVNQFEQVIFHWVKGHSGHPQNEYCDHLLNECLDAHNY